MFGGISFAASAYAVAVTLQQIHPSRPPQPTAGGPFAATQVIAPDEQPPAPLTATTGLTGANAAVPDVVTDIAGLPSDTADAADPTQRPTLSHIGRYALKQPLGSGGLGTVYEAWDPLLSRVVAVKTLQFDLALGERVALDGLFLNEARAAAGLNHRYIVTIHDAGLSAHGVYIAMERLHGRDLQQALSSGWRPGVVQAVQLLRRISDALAYAHARGVVHCDIKPANIFLQRRDRPKLLDFGIARIVQGRAASSLAVAAAGSPHYRAPEQLTGGPVDARADLFALGAVMYELLAGRRAFEGSTLADIDHAVLECRPPPLQQVAPQVPPELARIVAALLAREPSERYASAADLNADLRQWLHGQPTAPSGAAGRSTAVDAAPQAAAAALHVVHAPSRASSADMLSPASSFTASHPLSAEPSPSPSSRLSRHLLNAAFLLALAALLVTVLMRAPG